MPGMEYYKTKAAAALEIDQLVIEGKKIEEIVFIINTKYGMTRKLVEERVKIFKAYQEAIK